MTEIVHKFDRELDMTPEEEDLFDQYILEQEMRKLDELSAFMHQEWEKWRENDNYFHYNKPLTKEQKELDEKLRDINLPYGSAYMDCLNLSEATEATDVMKAAVFSVAFEEKEYERVAFEEKEYQRTGIRH